MRLVALFLLAGIGLWGCEADGLIWMPPTNKADALFRIVVDGRAGFIDQRGRIVVPPTLRIESNWSQAFYDGLLSLGASTGPFLNIKGEKVLDAVLDRLWDFSEGLGAARKTSDANWGYVDHLGKFVIPPKFAPYPEGLVSTFSEGLAAIETAGKLGYIDRSGAFVIQQKFVAGTPFENGIARVVVDGPCQYWDYEHFDPCVRMSSHPAPRTGAAARSGSAGLPSCKWGFIDKTGRRIMNAEFEAASGFQDGLAAVLVAGLWGYIDEQGTFVIPPQFERADIFSSGLALVGDGEKERFIDKSGKATIQVDKHTVRFSEGLTTLGDPDNGYIYIDTRGKQAFPGRFWLASRYLHGLAHVKLDRGPYYKGTFAYIDPTGKQVFTYRR